MISLLAGKPNAALFPFTSVQFTAPSCAADGSVTGSEQTLLKVDDDVLAMGLQYAPTSGMLPMVEWLTEFQEQEHARSRSEGWRVSVTAGSQDAIYKVRRGWRLTAIIRSLYLAVIWFVHRFRYCIPGYPGTRGPRRSRLDREACLCVRLGRCHFLQS